MGGASSRRDRTPRGRRAAGAARGRPPRHLRRSPSHVRPPFPSYATPGVRRARRAPPRRRPVRRRGVRRARAGHRRRRRHPRPRRALPADPGPRPRRRLPAHRAPARPVRQCRPRRGLGLVRDHAHRHGRRHTRLVADQGPPVRGHPARQRLPVRPRGRESLVNVAAFRGALRPFIGVGGAPAPTRSTRTATTRRRTSPGTRPWAASSTSPC